MAKRIGLTNGKVALVSDSDHAYLMRWSWGYNRAARRYFGKYAQLNPGV